MKKRYLEFGIEPGGYMEGWKKWKGKMISFVIIPKINNYKKMSGTINDPIE